jgi:hypothetical protein
MLTRRSAQISILVTSSPRRLASVHCCLRLNMSQYAATIENNYTAPQTTRPKHYRSEDTSNRIPALLPLSPVNVYSIYQKLIAGNHNK